MNMQEKTINLHVSDKDSLYASYMPFIKNGGLFIPTNNSFCLGEELSLTLTLFDETEAYTLPCKVIWITPRHAQGRRVAGIGVQLLLEQGKEVKMKIENHLIGTSYSGKSTETM